MLVALGESAYLRARLRHRLKALYSSCGSLKQWNDGLSKSGLSDSLKFLNLSIYPERRRKESPISFVSSSRLGGDLYRLQDPDLLLTEEDVSIIEPVPAEEAWNDLSKLKPIQLSQHAIPQLAEGQSLIGASPVLRFNRDSALRSHPEESVHPGPTVPTARAMELSHQEEFVYLELVQSQTQSDTLGASELGVLVALFAEADGSDEARGGSYCYVVALPGVCSFRDFQGSSTSVRLIQLRVNFGQLLTVFPDVLDRVGIGRISAYALQFFVVAEND
jgi:hypothetical protein